MLKKIFFLTLIILSACSKKEFKPLERTLSLNLTSSNAQFCEPTITEVKATTFYIFITDSSASQSLNDREGQLRFTPIFDFILNNQGTPEDRYALMLFADEGQIKLPLQDQDTFKNNMTQFWQLHQWEDKGFSNMAGALSLVKTTLEQFALDHRFDEIKPYANVQVILLSDGYPQVPSGRIPEEDILQIIKGNGQDGGIMGIVNDSSLSEFFKSIKIHTAYYWGNYLGGETEIPEDPENRKLMKNIAEAGNGRFMEFKDGQMVDLSQFQQVEAKLRKQLISYYIVPEGMIWDTNKLDLVSDFDQDGLPDYKEIELGSNFSKKDTDEDGVSDGIQYRVTSSPCRDESCKVSSRLDPLCQSYLKADGTIRDSDGDTLNDCEEFYLKSNKEAIDSNANFLADMDEFLLGNNLTQANLLTGDADGDGLSDFEEIRKFLPIYINNKLLTSRKNLGMEYELKRTGQLEDGRICYKLHVDKVPLSNTNNRFKLMLVYQNSFMSKATYFYQATGTLGNINNIKQSDIHQLIGSP